METPTISSKELIAQAPQWNFEGDCKLLDFMKQISQNLEQRATLTTKSLQRLSANVKRTSTALDNATNSLSALQYTQFVESRCHDDDEGITHSTSGQQQETKASEPAKSSKEILKTFLKNNLEMLHNCHEKYSLDFDDSDEEDVAINYIYQPKNPYNDRPLPHIYGSKLWKECWHVGLCDGANEYSGDEKSEEFSDSSSMSADGSGSTPANLSEWASSTSITNEKFQTRIAVQNASSLQDSQTLVPEDAKTDVSNNALSLPLPVEGSANRTPIAAATPVPYQRAPDNDLFGSLSHTPATSSSSSATFPPQPAGGTFLEYAHSSSLSSSNASAPVAIPKRSPQFGVYATPPPMLPDEPPEHDPTKPPASSQQIKRKPVNLFDDEDFNSFMTEIVEKAQSKSEPPKPATRRLSSEPVNKAVPPMPSQRVEPPPIVSPRGQTIASNETRAPEAKKKETLNLFDSPEGSPRDEPLFTPIAQGPRPAEDKTVVAEKTKITAKSLFDDEDGDDDDDFLNVFSSKKNKLPESLGKTLLFSDDKGNMSTVSNAKPLNIQKSISKSLFDDDDDNDDELFISNTSKANKENKAKEIVKTAKVTKSSSGLDEDKTPVTATKSNLLSTKLFLDDEDEANDDLFGKKAKISQKSKEANEEKKSLKETEIPRISTEKSEKEIYIPEQRINEVKDETEVHAVIEETSNKSEEIMAAPSSELSRDNAKEENDEQSSMESSAYVTESVDLTSTESIPPKPPQTESADIEKPSEEQPPSTEVENVEEAPPAEKLPPPQPQEPDQKDLSLGKSSGYEYSSIFLDEPPDDDFFQTLGGGGGGGIGEVGSGDGGSHTHSSNAKMSLDLDNDFLEPPLPQVPLDGESKASSSAVNQEYSGLRLFSDIPPDDEDEAIVGDNSPREDTAIKDISENKRLHSVFYDDFSETLEAIKKPSETKNKLPIHSLFDDEPPSDDDDFDVISSVMKGGAVGGVGAIVKDATESEEKKTPITPSEAKVKGFDADLSRDVTDKVASPRMEVKTLEAVKSALKESVAQKTQTPPPPSASISKLQMPKININVQALLPGAGGKPIVKKPINEQISVTTPEARIESPSPLSSKPATPSNTSQPMESSNKNILENVNKNRVRAPVNRRPSTRRGRQESYQKSLEAERAELVKDKDRLSYEKKKNIITNDIAKTPEPPRTEERSDLKQNAVAASLIGQKSLADSLFSNEDDETGDDLLFTPQVSKKIEIPRDRESPTAREVPTTHRSSSVATPKSLTDPLFGSSPPEDSLFAAIKSTGPTQTIKSVNPITKTPSSADKLFVDSDDDEGLFTARPSTEISTPALVKSPRSEEPSTLVKKSSSLFDDDDDDGRSDSDKELFKVSKQSKGAMKKIPSAVAVAKELPPKAAASKSSQRSLGTNKYVDSLFDSDDDDDEDGFLKALKKSEKPKLATAKAAAKPQSKASGGSLFGDSDSEGDNDLFGNAQSSKVRIPKASSTSTSARSTNSTTAGIVKAPAKSTNPDDNPLADLLNS